MADLQRTFARVHRLFQQAETQLAPQAQESLATARQAVDAAGEAMQTPLLLQRDARQAREQLARALTALDALANLVEQRPASLVWGSAAAF
jgi:paraquat-inducible protein B